MDALTTKRSNNMLQLILGPMFSSKTTELLRRIERAQIAGQKAVLLRPNRDTRKTLTHSPINVDV